MQPILFQVPGTDWEVQSYGFLLGLALLLGWIVSVRLASRDGLPADALGTGYVLVVVAAMLAARAAWLWDSDGNPGWRELFALQAGGMSPLAGIVVGSLVAVAYARAHKVSVLAWADCLAPACALAIVLERLGAFLAGSSFGAYVDPTFPVGVRFPVGSPVFLYQRRTMELLIAPGSSESLPVHPVQLYAACLALLGLLGCWWWTRRRRFTGQITLAYAAYQLLAFALIEAPVRGDIERVTLISTPQVLAVLGAVFAGTLYWVRAQRTSVPEGGLEPPT